MQDLYSDWAEFCESLKSAGDVLKRAATPHTELDQAEGVRYLTRLLRAALEKNLEFADPAWPVFYSLSHETIKIGSDNPDNIYRNCTISADFSYRVSGILGNAKAVTFGTKAEQLALDGTISSCGEVSISDMILGSGGSFELTVSAVPADGNWLRLTDSSTMLIVRETFSGRSHRKASEIKIERIAPSGKPALIDSRMISSALGEAANFVSKTASVFADWMQVFQSTPNDWTVVDQSEWRKIGGDPRIFYLWAYWELKTDEALVITTPVPDCQYWNVQVNNYWDESLDYRYFQIHHNCDTVAKNEDGSVTIVLSHTPVVSTNWLDTAGHDRGALMWRWVGSNDHPIPVCKVVKLSDLT